MTFLVVGVSLDPGITWKERARRYRDRDARPHSRTRLLPA